MISFKFMEILIFFISLFCLFFSMASITRYSPQHLSSMTRIHTSQGHKRDFLSSSSSSSFFFFTIVPVSSIHYTQTLFVQWMNKTKTSKSENSGAYKHLWFHLHMWFHI